MCAVLIAENTANAHHSPQSISENLVINPFGNKYRVHIRKQYERQVKQGVVCVVAVLGSVSAGSGSLAVGRVRLHGLLGCLPLRLQAGSWFSLGWVWASHGKQKNMTSNQSKIVSSGRAFSRYFSRNLPHPLPNFTNSLKKN